MHRETDSTTMLVHQQNFENNLEVYTPASVSPMMSPTQLTPRASHTQQDLPHSPSRDQTEQQDLPADFEVEPVLCIVVIALTNKHERFETHIRSVTIVRRGKIKIEL